jgi:hypothetical protein
VVGGVVSIVAAACSGAVTPTSNVGVHLDPAGCMIFREVVRPSPQPTVSQAPESLGAGLRKCFSLRPLRGGAP